MSSHFDDPERIADAFIYEDGWMPTSSDPLRYIGFWAQFEEWRREQSWFKPNDGSGLET